MSLVLTIDCIYKALKAVEMRNVSTNGVTDSGINKLVASLKRRDLIRRTGHQQLTLMPKALELLKSAATLSKPQATV